MLKKYTTVMLLMWLFLYLTVIIRLELRAKLRQQKQCFCAHMTTASNKINNGSDAIFDIQYNTNLLLKNGLHNMQSPVTKQLLQCYNNKTFYIYKKNEVMKQHYVL